MLNISMVNCVFCIYRTSNKVLVKVGDLTASMSDCCSVLDSNIEVSDNVSVDFFYCFVGAPQVILLLMLLLIDWLIWYY